MSKENEMLIALLTKMDARLEALETKGGGRKKADYSKQEYVELAGSDVNSKGNVTLCQAVVGGQNGLQIDVRQYYKADCGEYKPTKSGTRISLEDAVEFANEILKFAEQEGMTVAKAKRKKAKR